MNTKHRRLTLAGLVLAISAFGEAPANAIDSSGNVLMHKVNFAELDLSRPAGAETLYRRIERAAEEVCAPFTGRQLIEKMNRKACIASAVERAVRQVNAPLLTDYYLSLKPGSEPASSLAAER
jgi:UrcA family protein